MNDFEALVSLNLIPQIGSVKLEQLLKYFGQSRKIFKAPARLLAEVTGERLAQEITRFNHRCLDRDLTLAKKSGVEIITFLDQRYPQALKDIPAYPIVLYCLGQITAADNLAVGIVGSRRASFYGLSNAENFAAQLSVRGVTIVSGLARGVDTYAHRGALKAAGRTIAVMGSGFNHIYPAENADLVRKISAAGAVVSEFSMETKPLPQNFPRRNRLISGLSRGILITEAARNSGALITADFALEQGRDVFALPGRIDSTVSMGTNILIKQGAKLVTSCEDILEELDLAEVNASEVEPPAVKRQEISGKEENRIYEYIRQEPVAIDDLVQKSSLSSSQVLNLVLKLEFEKLIRTLPGKYFIRN